MNALSPGNTPDTNAADKLPAFTRRMLLPIMKRVPDMSHSTSEAAGRYLEVIGFGPEMNGMFFASKPKRMTGLLRQVRSASFDNVPVPQALWNELERLTADTSTESRR